MCKFTCIVYDCICFLLQLVKFYFDLFLLFCCYSFFLQQFGEIKMTNKNMQIFKCTQSIVIGQFFNETLTEWLMCIKTVDNKN